MEKTVTKTKIPEHAREQLLAAIAAEIKGEFVQRRKINELSPSFPYNHRTLANRDSLHTGVRGAFMAGKHIFYPKAALLEMLREDLSR